MNGMGNVPTTISYKDGHAGAIICGKQDNYNNTVPIQLSTAISTTSTFIVHHNMKLTLLLSAALVSVVAASSLECGVSVPSPSIQHFPTRTNGGERGINNITHANMSLFQKPNTQVKNPGKEKYCSSNFPGNVDPVAHNGCFCKPGYYRYIPVSALPPSYCQRFPRVRVLILMCFVGQQLLHEEEVPSSHQGRVNHCDEACSKLKSVNSKTTKVYLCLISVL